MQMCVDRDDPPASPQEAISRRVRALALEVGARSSDCGFTRLFPALDAPASPPPGTLAALDRLAAAMAEPEAEPPQGGDGAWPAAYADLVSFVHHDMVWERPQPPPAGPDFQPLDVARLLNRRPGGLDLDSLYDAPRDPEALHRMLLGPHGTDLPRFAATREPARDRRVRMADPRNDASLILSQLHLAFLKAHNALTATGLGFDAARRALRRRYQSLVLDDLARRLCDPDVHDAVLDGHRLLPRRRGWRMPVEFSHAAFVLAPSLGRARYDYAPALRAQEQARLTPRVVLGGGGRGPGHLPPEAVIDWGRFLPLEARAPQRVRRLDTFIAGPPQSVRDRAAAQFLTGCRLGLPTGQAVARHLGLRPLEGEAFLAALPAGQREAATPFAAATPLWFYVLAEAGDPQGPDGRHLGPVGSRIVMETLWDAVSRADGSILSRDLPPDFGPFTLTDLVLLAAEADRD